MVVYDSSVLIEYLDDEDSKAAEYIEAHLDERQATIPLVMFEVYQGEVFKPGTPDLDRVRAALSWLDVLDETHDLARSAGELQAALAATGEPLTARDAYIAGAAMGLDERLVVADSDFDVQGITDSVEVDFL